MVYLVKYPCGVNHNGSDSDNMTMPTERKDRRGEIRGIYDEARKGRNGTVQLLALIAESLVNIERSLSEIERNTVTWPVEGPDGENT